MFLGRGKILFRAKEQFQKGCVDWLRHPEITEVTFDELHLNGYA